MIYIIKQQILSIKMKDIPDSKTEHLTEVLKFEALERDIGDQKIK